MSRTFWTSSAGIAGNSQLTAFFAVETAVLRRITPLSQPSAQDVVLGWGNKANTRPGRRFAGANGLPFIALEDGFIAYAGHPSSDSHRLSLIADETGIYYDASAPSDLELDCLQADAWFDASMAGRAQRLLHKLRASGCSKYNHPRKPLPAWLQAAEQPLILVVDQTFGDLSVAGAQADAADFSAMLDAALAENPDALILIKTHPDVLLGKKLGYFPAQTITHPRVRVIADDCAPAALFEKVQAVYCVSSQLGFEALWHGKTVHCFGLPFYAGWGLTRDRKLCPRRRLNLTLLQLLAAALIRYPRYVLPDGVPGQVEDVLDQLMVGSMRADKVQVKVCYAVGFSLWKRSFVPAFVADMAQTVRFVKRSVVLKRLAEHNAGDAAVLVWGGADDQLAAQVRQTGSAFWRMEDGFVRSVGLGADLRRPSCLVIDGRGLYYRDDADSDLVWMLRHTDLSAALIERGGHLVGMLNRLAVTKYNVGDQGDQVDRLVQTLRTDAGGRELILVPGQFEADMSIARSRGVVKTNAGLLAAVRKKYPQAYVVFKEHPDLYSGVRPGALGEQAALQHADAYVTHAGMHELLQICDRVCTMTSLTGFEALIRGKPVTVFGSPFYAGWGLTDDELVFPERRRRRSLAELVAIALILYCRCVDWHSRRLVSPERIIRLLADERELMAARQSLKSSWLARQGRKVRYLTEAFFS
ncbi:capsular polysaccharide biosynthesis protein [Thalassolituus sp. LLYu03]|uniref:capsular polysaccharide biosynthesis protein n=1 Tax=Thalassolituus sp. LLYu03 TaxID=3421656 RepID=UPI003D272916